MEEPEAQPSASAPSLPDSPGPSRAAPGLFAPVERSPAPSVPRWKPTAAQKAALNEHFAQQPYPSLEQKASIARELNVQRHQVAKWFQHRREALSKAGQFNGQKQRERRTPQELAVLEAAFSEDAYPSADRLRSISAATDYKVSTSQIKLWFKHRRHALSRRGVAVPRRADSSDRAPPTTANPAAPPPLARRGPVLTATPLQPRLLSKLELAAIAAVYAVAPEATEAQVSRLAAHLLIEREVVSEYFAQRRAGTPAETLAVTLRTALPGMPGTPFTPAAEVAGVGVGMGTATGGAARVMPGTVTSSVTHSVVRENGGGLPTHQLGPNSVAIDLPFAGLATGGKAEDRASPSTGDTGGSSADSGRARCLQQFQQIHLTRSDGGAGAGLGRFVPLGGRGTGRGEEMGYLSGPVVTDGRFFGGAGADPFAPGYRNM